MNLPHSFFPVFVTFFVVRSRYVVVVVFLREKEKRSLMPHPYFSLAASLVIVSLKARFDSFVIDKRIMLPIYRELFFVFATKTFS